MILKPRRMFLNDSRLTLTAANFPAQTIKVPIPRTAPYGIEEIIVTVQVTINAGIAAGIVAWGLMNILKKVVLGNIPNADGTASNKVDASGAALLQLGLNEGLNLDRSTLATLYANNRPNLITGGVYRLCYRIPLVHPMLTDGLRPRCVLPTFTYNQDPLLQLDFSGAAEMSGDANPFTAASVEVALVTRFMADADIKQINDTGGFINWDLIETQYSLATGLSNSPQKFAIPTPGAYTGINLFFLKGNATVVPGDISASTAVGTETEWQIKAANKDIWEQFRLKHLQAMNDWSRTFNGPAVANNDGAAYAQNSSAMANFGGPLATGRAIQEPASVFLDFAGDGVTDIRELGSLFDTKQYADKGLEVAFAANVTTPANNPSVVSVLGRRLFGDLSSFKA